jgi:formylglycine-generating enzyme required for sulfatase activity/DNA-binding winged helix-turn-helix (wHTH) protein
VEEQPRDGRASIVRFGPFELDTRAAELRKGGLRIRLQDQPFQILLMLLERPGEVVLREDIRKKLWPDGTLVEFDHGINSAVKRLRDALRESAEKPLYIETLARRGYRFIGRMEVAFSQPAEVEADETTAATERSPAEALELCSLQLPRSGRPPPWFRRPRTLIAILLAAMALVALAVGLNYRLGADSRWVREVARPEATRLVNAGIYPAAFPLLHRALQILPADRELNGILREISHPVSVRTTPPGADVSVKPYGEPESQWVSLGPSPLENFLLPQGSYRWRVSKPGFQTVESAAGMQAPIFEFVLDPEGSVPPEMVHVPDGNFRFSLATVHVNDYWLDKYEVTNRQFKEFVDQGGYRKQHYWHQEFIKEGRVLSYELALAEFRDATGRPGPSTWEVGDYPPGHDDFPVNGVSWYEAMAYAEFAKKQIPTVYHWLRAASQGIYSDILLFSNFDGSGPVRVGSRSGLGQYGTYDMAGNVREWCSNAIGNRRYILGGDWKEGRYKYSAREALSPFDRSAGNGFRCIKYPGRISEELTRDVERPSRDHRKEKPVTDSVFQILQSFYSYDRTELKATTDSVNEASPYWRAEKISFDAAYGHERVTAWLYVPRSVKPPYQTVIYFPATHARLVGRIDDAEIKRFDFLIRGGRAVLFPIYQGTYERRSGSPPGPSGARDRTIQQCKDFRRSVDYLETRPDIASDRLGYFGLSEGARLGSILLAQESRMRAAVLSGGGLSPDQKPPEIDEINFASRVRIPVLMINGRYDFPHPVETDQIPMFRLLGASEKDKRHVLFDTGHYGPPQQDIKEALDWFDRYLGPVGR